MKIAKELIWQNLASTQFFTYVYILCGSLSAKAMFSVYIIHHTRLGCLCEISVRREKCQTILTRSPDKRVEGGVLEPQGLCVLGPAFPLLCQEGVHPEIFLQSLGDA